MDEDNGLLYMRAMYYDPEVGRFISKDPIGFIGGLNLYGYAANNPTNKADPRGLNGTGIPFPIPKPMPNPIDWTKWRWLTFPISAPIAVAGAIASAIVLCPSDITKEDDCAAEWEEAYRECGKELSSPAPRKGITGGYKNLHDCARGLVSE
jgi:hypothetical protein